MSFIPASCGNKNQTTPTGFVSHIFPNETNKISSVLKPDGSSYLEHLCSQAQKFLTGLEVAFPAMLVEPLSFSGSFFMFLCGFTVCSAKANCMR